MRFFHILDSTFLILSCGTYSFPPILSFLSFISSLFRCLVTFEFLLLDYTPLGKNIVIRCLPDKAVARFKAAIPSAVDSLPYHNITEDSYADLIPSQIDHLVHSAAGSMKMSCQG